MKMKRLLWIVGLTVSAIGLLVPKSYAFRSCPPDDCVTRLFCHAACNVCEKDGDLGPGTCIFDPW